MKWNILISDPLAEEGVNRLRKEKNFEVTERFGMKEEELIELIPEYHALIIRSETKVTDRVIEVASKLKVIGRAGSGLDNVNIEVATRKGIVVMNTPEGNTISAAEHTISMILALSRNIPQANASLKEGRWERKRFMGTEVYGKTLGIVGLGKIGEEVAKRAQGLQMKVIACDPFVSQEKADELGIALFGLEELLPQVDYLSLHTPLTPQTRNLIGKREISSMKKEARIINCARGGIIDEKILYRALKEGRLKGAALDVFEEEKPFNSPLMELDAVVFTPHLGASTEEAQKRVSVDMASQVIDILEDGKIRNAVNIPTLSPQVRKKIGPYLSLAEKMGYLEAQLSEGHPNKLKVVFSGKLVNFDVNPLTVALVKGLLSFVLKEDVNYVNALILAGERGIGVEETKTSDAGGFTNLISATLITDLGQRRIDGTIFERTFYIVRIDDYSLEFVPRGELLICANEDKPGVVGKIATVLGRYRINIAGLQMGRKSPGRKNVSVYSLDSSPSSKAMEEISKIPEVIEAKLVHL